MEHVKWLVLSLFITGCSGCQDCGIEQRWYPTYLEFFAKAKEAGIDIFPFEYNLCSITTVDSYDDDDSRIGQCRMAMLEEDIPFESHITLIDQKNEIDNRFLLFHELTHCIFNLDHTSDPNHIMSESLPGITKPVEEYERDLWRYIKENSEFIGPEATDANP